MFSLSFPFCRCEAGHSSRGCYSLCFILLHVLGLSLHYSSSSSFFRSLFFTHSSHLSCGFVFGNLIVSLSQIFSVISRLSFWPHVHPISSGFTTILQTLHYASLSSLILILSTFFTPAILLTQLLSVVHVVAVRTVKSIKYMTSPYTVLILDIFLGTHNVYAGCTLSDFDNSERNRIVTIHYHR